MAKPIWIGSDHGGYERKLQVIEQLKKKGLVVQADKSALDLWACRVP